MRASAWAAALGLLLAFWLTAGAAHGAVKPPTDLPAGSWLLVEEGSGEVLASHGAAQELPVASATKLMTAHVAMGALAPDEEVVAAPYDPAAGESLMGLRPGESVPARDLYYGLLLASGNDAANALAIRVAGSVPAFVDRMNREAGRLGLGDTRFTDPIGLGEGNVSSARDLVSLATVLRQDELFREIVDRPKVTVDLASGPKRLVNRNTLIAKEPFVDGVKTGSTVAAGYVLVGSAAKHGAEFVSAVLGAPNEADRDEATLALLRYGAALYRPRILVSDGDLIATLPLGDGRGKLRLVAGDAVSGVALPGQEVRIDFEPPEPPEDAVRRGEQLGLATVTAGGEQIGEVPVVAARAVRALPEEGGSGLPGWAVAVLATAGVLAAGLGLKAVSISRG